MSVDRARWERWSEEDAFSFCVEFLTEYTNGRLRRDRTEFDISATEVESQLCLKHQITEHNDKLDLGSLTGAKILSALWQLWFERPEDDSILRFVGSVAKTSGG